MDQKPLPDFSPVQQPELQALCNPGVAISGPASIDVNSAFVISGRFIVSQEEFDRLDGSPHRHLVMTVMRDSQQYGSVHPLKNCMIFRDDINELSGASEGWFTLDVWTCASFRYEGIYHVRVSLGEALSNFIETVVAPELHA